MPFKLLVTPIAQENIEEAYNYYFENAGIGVAEWFLRTCKVLMIPWK